MASSGSLAALWTPLEQSGYLDKKGHSRKIWQRRYFILKGGYLFYFKDRKNPQVAKRLHGVIPLESAKIETELPASYGTKQRRDNPGPAHVITITLHTSVAFACKHPFYVLRAPSQEVQVAWVNAMWQAAIPRADLVQHLAAAGKLADVVATYAVNVQNAFPTADASVLSTGGRARTAALANVGSLAGMIRSAKFAPALSNLDALPVVNPNQMMLATQSILARTVSGNVVTAAPHTVITSPRAIEALPAVASSAPAVVALPPASPAPAPAVITLPPASALPTATLPPASTAAAKPAAAASTAADAAGSTAASGNSAPPASQGKEKDTGKGKEAGKPPAAPAAPAEIKPAGDATVTTSRPAAATGAAAKLGDGEASGIWGKLDAAISRLDATAVAVAAAKAEAGKVSQVQEVARLDRDAAGTAAGGAAPPAPPLSQQKKDRADAGVGPSAPLPTPSTAAAAAGTAAAATAAGPAAASGDGTATVSLPPPSPPKLGPSPLGAKPSVTAELPAALLGATLSPSPRDSGIFDVASEVPKHWLDNPLAHSLRSSTAGSLALRADEAAELLAKLDATSGPLPASTFKPKATKA